MTKDRRTFSSKPVGQRQLRVGEQIRHALSGILREAKFRDPALQNPGVITITVVEIGADLKHAHAYVMPLGGQNADEIIDALNRASTYLRSELAKHLETRYTPKLTFRFDHSFDDAAYIEGLLGKSRDTEMNKDEEE